MCGRYSLGRSHLTQLSATLGQEFPPLAARFNIAPGQDVPCIRQDGSGYVLEQRHWGLIPPWARDTRFGQHTINARAETVADKPAFRSAFRRHRCLIPADGFYEWQATPQGKQPWYFRLASGQDFAFAGLWEHWERSDQVVDSCTIIVRAANPLVNAVHDRMPVILDPADYATWLDPAQQDPIFLQTLLQAYSEELMQAWPVSRAVNASRVDCPELIEPVG